MKLQTSGVLGTSYAIAKLAPKRGFDKKQKKSFYYFYEVGTKIKANGISKDNKLYIDNLLNIIVGNPSTKTTDKEYYRVTEVRKNHNQTY